MLGVTERMIMALLHAVLLLLHILGLLAILFFAVPQLWAEVKQVKSGMLHGVAAQLVTGFGLVYVIGARGVENLNYGLVGVKLLFLIVIFGLIFSGRNKERVAPGLIWAIVVLTLANAGIASMLTS